MGFPGTCVHDGDLLLTEQRQLAVNNCSRKLENVKVSIEREECSLKTVIIFNFSKFREKEGGG